MATMLRPDVEFVAAHPMAGREISGVENSTDRMFFGANYIVTLPKRTRPKLLKQSLSLADFSGFPT